MRHIKNPPNTSPAKTGPSPPTTVRLSPAPVQKTALCGFLCFGLTTLLQKCSSPVGAGWSEALANGRLGTEPVDIRTGTATVLAQAIAVFCAVNRHCACLLANRRANRMKVLLPDGISSAKPRPFNSMTDDMSTIDLNLTTKQALHQGEPPVVRVPSASVRS